MTRIYFKSAIGENVGMGHIYRCISLAQMLPDGFESCILTTSGKYYYDLMTGHFDHVIEHDLFVDMIDEAVYLSQQVLNRGDILILDGYAFDYRYQQLLKNAGVLLVSVFDHALGRSVSDVVVNHGSLYENLEKAFYTRVCLGTEYFMGREAFRNETQVPARPLERITDIFVCFGAADPLNLGKACVELLQREIPDSRQHVVVGSDYCVAKDLAEIAAGNRRIRLYKSLDAYQMATLMKKCQLGIVSASGISLEACCIGMGLIAVAYTDNQHSIEELLRQKQLAQTFRISGVDEFHCLLPHILQNCNSIQINSQIQAQKTCFIDTKDRFKQLFLSLVWESSLFVNQQNEKSLFPDRYGDNIGLTVNHSDNPLLKMSFRYVASSAVHLTYDGLDHTCLYPELVIKQGLLHFLSQHPEVKRIYVGLGLENLKDLPFFEKNSFQQINRGNCNDELDMNLIIS